jgi:hypothetical protein
MPTSSLMMMTTTTTSTRAATKSTARCKTPPLALICFVLLFLLECFHVGTTNAFNYYTSETDMVFAGVYTSAVAYDGRTYRVVLVYSARADEVNNHAKVYMQSLVFNANTGQFQQDLPDVDLGITLVLDGGDGDAETAHPRVGGLCYDQRGQRVVVAIPRSVEYEYGAILLLNRTSTGWNIIANYSAPDDYLYASFGMDLVCDRQKAERIAVLQLDPTTGTRSDLHYRVINWTDGSINEPAHYHRSQLDWRVTSIGMSHGDSGGDGGDDDDDGDRLLWLAVAAKPPTSPCLATEQRLKVLLWDGDSVVDTGSDYCIDLDGNASNTIDSIAIYAKKLNSSSSSSSTSSSSSDGGGGSDSSTESSTADVMYNVRLVMAVPAMDHVITYDLLWQYPTAGEVAKYIGRIYTRQLARHIDIDNRHGNRLVVTTDTYEIDVYDFSTDEAGSLGITASYVGGYHSDQWDANEAPARIHQIMADNCVIFYPRNTDKSLGRGVLGVITDSSVGCGGGGGSYLPPLPPTPPPPPPPAPPSQPPAPSSAATTAPLLDQQQPESVPESVPVVEQEESVPSPATAAAAAAPSALAPAPELLPVPEPDVPDDEPAPAPAVVVVEPEATPESETPSPPSPPLPPPSTTTITTPTPAETSDSPPTSATPQTPAQSSQPTEPPVAAPPTQSTTTPPPKESVLAVPSPSPQILVAIIVPFCLLFLIILGIMVYRLCLGSSAQPSGRRQLYATECRAPLTKLD